MTQTMTKEQILNQFKLDIAHDMWFFKLQNSEDEKMVAGVLNKIDEFFEQQLSAERERAGKLVEALNEYIVLLGEELDEVMGFVNAHQWKSTRFEKGEELRQKIKQTLNEYDTATKES